MIKNDDYIKIEKYEFNVYEKICNLTLLNFRSLMAKNYSKRNRTRKSIIAALCAVSVTCTGLAAACTPAEEEDNNKTTPSKEDTQVLKNGNFEFFNVPDKGVYLINNVNDWSLSGDTSVKSGIIGTSPAAWDKLTADDLAAKLDKNNDLTSSDDDYVDYNSMRSRDIPYRDTYAALLEHDDVDESWIKNQGYEAFFGITGDDTSGYKLNGKEVFKNADEGEYYFDRDFTQSIRKEYVDNPETHLGSYKEENGKYYLGTKEVYKDDDGNLFEDEKKENSVGNVLMIHNYATDGKYNGIQQSYSSSSITVDANTSVEISLWVKTSDLKFDKGYSALEDQDKGAFIEVVQTVAGTTLDAFSIKSINTEKILANAQADNETVVSSNGWLQYTIYINGCDFASSTVQLRLGLGGSGEEEKCTGYAFFDDVKVTKYRSLDAEGCTYSQNATTIESDKTACNLMSEADDKQFIADKDFRSSDGNRHAYDFYYLVDLASTLGKSENAYNSVSFSSSNVEAGLTTSELNERLYATAEKIESGVISGVGSKTQTDLRLVKGNDARPTANDLIGAYSYNYSFKASDFNGTDYSKLLNEGLTGESALPDANGNMIVMLSAWGAAYTSTVTDASFTLAPEECRIVTFWVKTSDMNGKTAATVKVYDVEDDTNSQTLTIDSTNITTNFEDEKDIYNGWAQCFVFVRNGYKNDPENNNSQTFKIDLSFGNTDIMNASSFPGGWAAFANLQTLKIDKEIFDLASGGDRTAVFTFSEEKKDNSGFTFDEETAISDIRNEISNASKYNGINGANSSVSGNDSRHTYDGYNSNKLAGLINRDYAEKYATDDYTWSTIASSFATASATWDEVFGKDCYQPLIIINNLRTYADRAEATETTVTNYYVLAEDDYSGETVLTNDGKKYRKATAEDWTNKTDDTVFYSLKDVCNYGFVSDTKTASANSYETVTVKVKVSGGAEAYIYLVDAENPEKLLGYETPAYTFYYDEEGNVLDEELDADWKETEHRSHIVYKVRNDGLYEKDNKVYANLYNLKKSFKNYKYEHSLVYDKDGNAVSFDNLIDGETYYTDSTATKEADHYLVNSEGTRVYECVDETYYYLEYNKDKKVYERTVEVNNFDKELANYTAWNEQFFVKVTDTNGEWQTVNFFIHTGSESKQYRLELWSGERTETGVNNGNYTEGAVAFDYSAYSVTSSNYSTLIGEYESNIIDAYKQLLIEKNKLDVIPSNSENISYYEEQLVEDGVLTQAEVDNVKAKFGYEAKYHTYNLYDSAAYVPFNANTAAEGETGYEYKVTDFSETLAYLTYTDYDEKNDRLISKNVFVDYSAVDQSISINTDNPSDDDNNDDEEEDTNFGDLMLYIASIILVVVLLFTLAVMFARMIIKNIRKKNGTPNKNLSKNVYRQRERYIRKLHLTKNEEEVEENAENEPVEETEAPAETEAPVEGATEETEAPAEEATETPAETEAPAETPAEPEEKPETPTDDSGEKPENN